MSARTGRPPQPVPAERWLAYAPAILLSDQFLGQGAGVFAADLFEDERLVFHERCQIKDPGDIHHSKGTDYLSPVVPDRKERTSETAGQSSGW